MEEAITEAKERRSRLKARLTTTAKLMNKASRQPLQTRYDELENIYSELLTVHYEYCDMVKSDDAYTSYQTVGGLSLDGYLEAIETIYSDAMQSYSNQLARSIDTQIKTADMLFSNLGNNTGDLNFFINEAESHLKFCKELSDHCDSVQDFNSEKLVECMYKLRQAVYKAKQSSQSVHCNQAASSQSHSHLSRDSLQPEQSHIHTSHDSLQAEQSVGGGVRSTPLVPRLESTRAGSGEIPGTSSHTISIPNVQSTSLVSSEHVVLPRAETSVVTVYKSGNVNASAVPLSDYNQRNDDTNSTASNFNSRKKSKFIKTPLPTFSGDRRAWADFRSVWRAHAEREFDDDIERAWVLKSCLKDKALDVVRAILVTQQGAYTRMWKRLDEVYCDVSLNIQCVHDELKRLRPVVDGDMPGLVRFVDQVELCYSQLGEVAQINSVTMPMVDELCDLLPISTRKDWMKTYRASSLENKIHPFSLFMSFLEDERDISRRLAERQRKRGDKSIKAHQTSATEDFCQYGPEMPLLNENPNSFSAGLHQTASGNWAVPLTKDVDAGSTINEELCIVHNQSHSTSKCRKFLSMTVNDRIKEVRKSHACYRCFGKHPIKKCSSKTKCSVCDFSNHHSLLCRKQSTEEKSTGGANSTETCLTSGHSANDSLSSGPALLLIQNVQVAGLNRSATVFFDSGSTGTFITHQAAKRLKAKRLRPVQLDLTTTGNVESQHSTYLYEVSLISSSQEIVKVVCFGLEQITGKVSRLDMGVISKLFPNIDAEALQRQSESVDILIGGELCGLHPRHEVANAGDHLKVLKGPFGLCLHGSHPELKLEGGAETHFAQISAYNSLGDMELVNAKVNHPEFQPYSHVTRLGRMKQIDQFIQGEDLGTELSIKCGACKCGKCPTVGHTFSFREEQELKVIRQNLHYDNENKRWITKYPWIKDPSQLPDNYHAALATLRNTEKTLLRDPSWAKVYRDQIMDMVDRCVAKKLSQEELKDWKGPTFYISHLAVRNPKSASTPVRIVFNSSQVHKGVSLNSFLAKGPDAYLNSLLGILLRWRERKNVLIGDIKKMYNSIHIDVIEQHCHRFLWRDLENRRPDVYVIQRVNMGDRPAAAISTEAVYSTAELFRDRYPDVACLLKGSTYVDDIVESVDTKEEALQLASDTTHVLSETGFSVKHWLFGGESGPRVNLNSSPEDNMSHSQTTQVLGVNWLSITDKIMFKAKLNFSKKKKGLYTQPDLNVEQIPKAIPESLTRRSVLEQVMRLYDPLGLLSPFVLKAKILLRETWELKLGWDEALPSDTRAMWIQFFSDMFKIESTEYDRCLKPQLAIGKPILVLMSDASDKAYGFSAYIRWQLEDGSFWCRLIFSKCRVAPLSRRLTTPQLELNGAVLSKRGRKVIEREMRFDFERVYHLVDSETVLCMINKVSTRFRLFEGVRVGEIQAATGGDMSSWFWVKGLLNTADYLTRGKSIKDLGNESQWWLGPDFLRLPEEQWDIKSCDQCKATSVDPNVMVCATGTAIPDTLLDYGRYSRFSSYTWCMARVLLICRQKSFSSAKTTNITPEVLELARRLIMKDVQRSAGMETELQSHLGKTGKGKYSRLHPVVDDLGIWIVGTRLLRNNPMALSPTTLPILLPHWHQMTSILMRDAHIKSGHRGRDVTLAKFRQNYWCTNGSKLARRVVNDCQKCRIRDVKLMTQKMGALPLDRLVPSPPFSSIMVDFFGPYLIRGEVDRRKSSRAYGVLYTDLSSRAIHIEVACGYDTASFLLTLRRFASIRGWPSTIYSDPGSQLVGAEKDLVTMWDNLDKEATYKVCSENGTKWIFGPADSSWHQGAVEVLVKAIKRVIKFSVNDQRLSATELLTAFSEAANIVNERPLGTLKDDRSEVSIVTPNSLLLGRSEARNPGGWSADKSLRGRMEVVSRVVQDFWQKWTMVYAPSLITQCKWKKRTRNLKPGDIVAVADSNSLCKEYRVAVVKEVYPGVDGIVRKVAVAYKNFRVGERVFEYSGAREVVIMRSIQRLALLCPVEGDMGSS